MLYPRVRGVLMTCGVAAMLFAAPVESKACGLLDCLFGGWGAQTTYRAPYLARTYAPAFTSVRTPYARQTCYYLPQTCYRTVYQRVPVTSSQAVTCRDPCTGCPVTTYRPVTTWTYQARLVPYTTYRLVYSNPRDPCVSYGLRRPLGLGVVTSLGPASSCCGPVSSGTVPYSAPSNAATVPTLDSGPRPKTWQNGGESPTESPEPTADPNVSSSREPELFDPNDRTTSLPIREAVHYRLIASSPKIVPVQRARTNNGGWRASSD